MKHYLLIVEYCEPSYDGPFPSESARDHAAKTIHAGLQEDGMIFSLDLEDDVPYLGSYSLGFFDEV